MLPETTVFPIAGFKRMPSTHTFGEIIYSQFAMWTGGEVFEGYVLLAFSHHEMDHDEGLEYDGPC